MKSQYTFFDLIIEVFDKVKSPLSPDEIWEKAVEFGFDKKLGSLGKTPSATVGARLYVDVKENGENSRFVQEGWHGPTAAEDQTGGVRGIHRPAGDEILWEHLRSGDHRQGQHRPQHLLCPF